MQFILAILIYPILFIADRKVTSKFKRNFGIEQKFYSPKRLNCAGISIIPDVHFAFSSLLFEIKD